MRTYEQIDADAMPEAPFSNGTMGYGWMGQWCYQCKVDGPFQRNEADVGCPIILVALFGKTPKEWTDQGLQDYHCSEFVPDDEGGGDEGPKPPPPLPGDAYEGQVDMFEIFAEQVADDASLAGVAGAYVGAGLP